MNIVYTIWLKNTCCEILFGFQLTDLKHSLTDWCALLMPHQMPSSVCTHAHNHTNTQAHRQLQTYIHHTSTHMCAYAVSNLPHVFDVSVKIYFNFIFPCCARSSIFLYCEIRPFPSSRKPIIACICSVYTQISFWAWISF